MQTLLTVLLLLIGFVAAVVGFFTLTQATQGAGLLALACFLGILARMSQAAAYQPKMPSREATDVAAGFLKPPSDGDWPPKPGEQLTLAAPLELRATASRAAPYAETIPAGTRFVVLTVRPQWLFVQTEDQRTEGWAETLGGQRTA